MLYGKFICAAKQQTIHPKTIEFYGSKRLYELLRIFPLTAPLSFPKLQASSQFLSRKGSEIVVRQVGVLELQTFDDLFLYFLRDTGIVCPPYRDYLNVVRNSSQIC